MTKRRILKTAAIAFGLCMFLSLVAGVFVAEGALRPARRQLTAADEAREILRARDEDGTLTDVSIAAGDGIQLRGWDLHPEHTNGSAVILLHGVRRLLGWFESHGGPEGSLSDPSRKLDSL